jgi:putative hydrolase of the HAD superfamily
MNEQPRPARPARGFEHVEAWIFDLDNTLYPARHNLFAQIDKRMGEFIAALLGIDEAAAKLLQKEYFRRHGTTLRGLMIEHGIEPDSFLDYVHRIDLSVVPADARLQRALKRLPGRKLIFTNGTVAHAERVTAHLGIAAHFEAVFDIAASDYLPKPDRRPYEKLLKQHAIRPERALMVEDIARNLEPAAALGMTTALVTNPERWARDGHDGAHVHHLVDDLSAWLAGLAGIAA